MSDMDYSDFGREIGEKIEKFVNSKEIKDLQENIKSTVEKTMQDVGRSVKEATDYVNKNVEIRWDSPGREYGKSSGASGAERKTETGNARGERMNRTDRTDRHARTRYDTCGPYTRFSLERNAAVSRQLPAVKRPEGSVSGILLMVFGTVGAFVSLLSALPGFLAVLTGSLSVLGGAAFISFPAVTGGACIAAALAGGFLRRRAVRFKRYVRTMGVKDFYPVSDLARAVGKKEKYTVKDLKKMIKRGWFSEGHLDEQETCFMLTEEAFTMYRNAQKELERQKEQKERLAQEQERMEQDPVLKQLKVTVEEGKEYIRRIREVNDDIPGEDISQKLYRLEKITVRIFDHVKENPDKLPDIRRFMNYYLPTTLKLVESYLEFCTQPVQGENITTAEKEIEGMLDEINGAFEKMFDQLFADDAMDISTDISVMSAMLAQEGLLENEFEKTAGNGKTGTAG